MTDLETPHLPEHQAPEQQVPATRSSTPDNDLVLPLVGWGTYIVGWGLVGLVIAFVDRKNAPPHVRNNYTYMIRTFWIGCLYVLLGFLLAGLCFVLISAMDTGGVWAGIVLWGLLPTLAAIWFLARCVKGIVLLVRRQDVANPGTWWV